MLLSQFSDNEIRSASAASHCRRERRIPDQTPPLLTEIRRCAKRGYAVSDEELELGIRALAVPVIGANDEIIAAVSVSAASARVRSADLRRRFVPVLQSCARLLAEAVGEAG